MKITDRDLRGRPVIGADGRVLGHVSGLSLDSDGPVLATIEVELKKNLEDELGVEHRMFRSATIDVPFVHVQSIGDTVVLAIALDAVRALAPQPAQTVPA